MNENEVTGIPRIIYTGIAKPMKYKLLFVLFFVNIMKLSAQDTQLPDTISLNIFDVYGLKVKIERMLLTDKYGCAGTNPKHKSSLYKIAIQQIYFQRDTVVYRNKEELAGLNYLLNDDKVYKMKVGKEYYLTAYNSTVPEYIVSNQIFDKKVHFSVDPYSPYQANLIGPCKKLKLCQKIALFFGANEERIYAKANNKDNHQNPFWKAIHSM